MSIPTIPVTDADTVAAHDVLQASGKAIAKFGPVCSEADSLYTTARIIAKAICTARLRGEATAVEAPAKRAPTPPPADDGRPVFREYRRNSDGRRGYFVTEGSEGKLFVIFADGSRGEHSTEYVLDLYAPVDGGGE